jgi:adenylate cyclase
MIIKLHNWLIANDQPMTDEVQITRQLAIYSSIVNATTHGFLGLMFYWLGAATMVYYNFFIVFFFICLTFLARRNKLNLCWLLSAIEISIHSWLATYELGQIANFHLYILVSSGLWFLLSAPMVFKFGLTAFSTIITLILIAMTPIYPTDYDLDTVKTIGYINTVAQFGLLALIAGVYSMVVKQMRNRLNKEYSRSEALLQNILPKSIAIRLKENPEMVIADRFHECSVLFSDIVNFTQLSEKLSAVELVSVLNQIFSRFDNLIDKYKMEKIKTIGDAYMVASGVPKPNDKHAHLLADFALEMRNEMINFRNETGHNISIRIGMHSGNAVAGIIGKRKFSYDLWGDTVNTASRMESHGEQGRVHLTETTYQLLKGTYEMEERGELHIKGKGLMKTYFLNNKIQHSNS